MMFFILNRLRGGGLVFGYDLPWVHINSVILAVMFYLLDGNIYYSALIGLLYLVGESYGWGVWIGIIAYDGKHNYLDKEASKTGITEIANFFINPYKYGWMNVALKLSLRGIYWFAPLLLVVFFREHIDVVTLVASIGILGFGFPLAFTFAYMTSKYGDMNRKDFDTPWEQGEVWYGAMQDFVILLIILNQI